MRLPLVVETGDSVRDGAGESVGIGEGAVGELMLLEVAPTSLDVVQLGGVFGQPFEGEPGALGERLADLKNQATAGAIDLVFLDESEALTHPYLARCWTRRGSNLRIEAPGQAKKQPMLGALDPVHRRLLVHTSPTKRSIDFVALLDQLGAAYGTAERARPLVAVLDNGPIHRSRLTTRALAERTWLTLEWLPKYAPELNDPGSRPGQAIERCWRDLKQHYLANHTFADLDALDRTIHDAVARLNHERQPHSSPIPIRPA